MEGKAIKIPKLLNTLWNHKKKTILASGALIYGFDILRDYNRDVKLRHHYATRARIYGDSAIGPTERTKRLTVLINEDANGHKAYGLFTKNALFLFNLAGIEVNLIKVRSSEEMEKIAGVLDKSEADAIYVVGGDGTLSRVLSGMYKNTGRSDRLPLGIFPGGNSNGSLHRLIPSWFDKQDDVKKYCESAMALIDGTTKTIYPIKCEISDSDDPQAKSETYYLLSSIAAGWFEHCEQRKSRFWFIGRLKQRYSYFWEFLKRTPSPLKVSLEYYEFCSGCNKCRKPPGNLNQKKGWFSFFTSTTASTPSTNHGGIDYSKIINDKCMVKHEQLFETTNIEISVEQEAKNGSKLIVEAIPPHLGQIDAVKSGWKRCGKQKNLPDSDSIQAREVTLRFLELPEYIRKLSISGEWRDIVDYDKKTILLTTLQSGVEIYLPS